MLTITSVHAHSGVLVPTTIIVLLTFLLINMDLISMTLTGSKLFWLLRFLIFSLGMVLLAQCFQNCHI